MAIMINMMPVDMKLIHNAELWKRNFSRLAKFSLVLGGTTTGDVFGVVWTKFALQLFELQQQKLMLGL